MSCRVLVTGGAGFIGSNFVRWMLDRYPEYRIVVLDALTYAGSMTNLPPFDPLDENASLTFHLGNVCNAGLVNDLVAEADWVVHFAAETNVTRSIHDTTPFFMTDVIGTQIVANAVLRAGSRVKRFLHVSTSEVYGTAVGNVAMAEDHPLNPASPYASAKCGADRLVYSYWTTYGVPAVIVRPFNNYGRFQHLEKVIPRFITSCLLDESLTVHGEGAAERDFVHVADTCRALDTVLHAPTDLVVGEVFNVASGRCRSVLSIAHDVVGRMGVSADRIRYIGDRPGQVALHHGDWSKIHDVLGWRPDVDWDAGLDDTVAWFRENRRLWEPQIWLRTVPIRTQSGRIDMH
ncbi:dTDP-glucose 4,6-dehydratase [Azospirillum sp. ST 5-10]|uniref:dTDP-glucose 4,6-dehydratase n=1 Tax=unclassified Azospirillum TaxID=2630922 RepID=UPI003F49C6C1